MRRNFDPLSLSQYRQDARLLIIASGVFSVSFFGLQQLLKILYILRLGYGPEYIGLFNSMGAITYMLMSLPAGALGSRFGLHRTMMIGGVTTVLGMSLLPLTPQMPAGIQDIWPLFSQAVLTMGWSLFGVNQIPAIMTATTMQNRNRAYALNSALRGFGTFLGTVAGGMLPGLFVLLLGTSLDAPTPYALSLWVSMALAVTGLIPLARVRLEAEEISQEETSAPSASGAFPLLTVGLMLVFIYFGQSASAVCQSFCSAYMDAELHLSAAAIGWITGLGQLAATFAPFLAPRLAARRGNGWVLVVTTAGVALSLLPLALVPNWFGAGLGRFSTLAVAAIWMPALQVFQMELVDRQHRSQAYGAVSTAMGLCFGSISLAGGYIIAAMGYPSFFLFGTVTGLLGAGWMWAILRYSPIAAIERKQTYSRTT